VLKGFEHLKEIVALRMCVRWIACPERVQNYTCAGDLDLFEAPFKLRFRIFQIQRFYSSSPCLWAQNQQFKMGVIKRIGCIVNSDVAEFFCDFYGVEVRDVNAGN
jgi:hypothetical protein